MRTIFALASLLFVTTLACGANAAQELSPQAVSATPTPSPQPESANGAVSDANDDDEDEGVEKHWRFGGGIFYSFAKQLSFLSGNQGGTPYIYQYNGNGAWVFAGEVTYGAPHAWGVQVGLQIDGTRTITDYEEISNGISTKGTYAGGGQPKVNFFNMYLNVFYRWQKFYIPVGINHSVVGITDPPPALKDLAGGYGGQAGMGWEFNDHIVAEWLIRILTVRAKEQTGTAAGTIDAGSGYLTGSQLGLKVFF